MLTVFSIYRDSLFVKNFFAFYRGKVYDNIWKPLDKSRGLGYDNGTISIC